MRARRHINFYIQHVTAYQPPWRMNENVVANRVALWVQALQNTQRASVHMTGYGAASFKAVIQVKFGVPGHDKSLSGHGSVFASILAIG